MWRLATFVVALALLPACGAGAESSGASTSQTTTTTSAVTTPTSSPGPQTEKWFELDVGDCIAKVPQVELGEVDVTVVGCTTPHQAEVYFLAPVPVNAAVPEVANDQCVTAFPEYTGQAVDDSGLAVTYLVDSNQDRTTIAPTAGPSPSTVICLLQNAGGQSLTESARLR